MYHAYSSLFSMAVVMMQNGSNDRRNSIGLPSRLAFSFNVFYVYVYYVSLGSFVWVIFVLTGNYCTIV